MDEGLWTAKTYDHKGSVVEVSFEPDKEWVNLRVAGVSLMVSEEEWRRISLAGDSAMAVVRHRDTVTPF
jgi:hypothetical protein